MSVENIVDYVMKTPQNTNKMVLKGMLESEIENSSAGDKSGLAQRPSFMIPRKNMKYWTSKGYKCQLY